LWLQAEDGTASRRDRRAVMAMNGVRKTKGVYEEPGMKTSTPVCNRD
jgi:hypothetical protein